MTVSFQYPQLLALLLLLPLVVRWCTNGRLAVSTALRVAIAALFAVILAGPRIVRPPEGNDLVVLVDRSSSCGVEAEAMLREIMPIVVKQGGGDGRVAVVAFGDGAYVERGVTADSVALLPERFDAMSDLSAGLSLASGILDPARRSALLCLTDGLYTGDDPRDGVAAAALGNTPFWYRRLGGGGGLDAAAGEIVAPGVVQPRSAWPVEYTLRANAPCQATYSLTRNGEPLKKGEVRLNRGENRFFARDAAYAEGELIEYRLDIDAPGDVVRQNNRSHALVRVGTAPRALLVSHAESPGILGEALRAAAIPVDHVAPGRFPDSPAMLSPYKLVILENCHLTAMPGMSVAALAESVRTGVCSLLVTGGPNSLGMGGYHRSLLDPLLPVEMELRNETRRGGMAIAIALDRSGSMAMSSGHGRTKMDLANLGAAESIRLLSPADQVSVIAVDSAAHVIVPLSLADDVDRLAELTLSIQPMGGGIFCKTALDAAAKEVRKSPQGNRHIILFADASDAEEQEGCIELAKQLQAEGVGLSVVAMGEQSDTDAAFLRQLAGAGGGEALFSSDASGLPALFTQEIMRISKRGFIEDEVSPVLMPSLELFGVDTSALAPSLGGYNIGAAREGAAVHMRLDDEFHSPLLAIRSVGRASVGTMLFEVEGEFSGGFPRWRQTSELFVSLARRLAPGAGPEGVKAYSRIGRGVAEARFEFAPEIADAARHGDNNVRWLGPGGETVVSEMTWINPVTAISRLPLTVPGHYLPVGLFAGIGMVETPPVSLSHSPEFDAARGTGGQTLLRDLAAATGGGDALDLGMVWESARERQTRSGDFSQVLLLLLLALFLVELSGRRLLWFD